MAQTPPTSAWRGFETWFVIMEMGGKMLLTCILLVFFCVQLPIWLWLVHHFVRVDLLWFIPDLILATLRAGISRSSTYLIALGGGHQAPYPAGQVKAALASRLGPELAKMLGFFMLTLPAYLLLPSMLMWFRARSKKQAEVRHIRGTQRSTLENLKAEMARANDGAGERCDLMIGDVPLPVRSEVQHVQIVGTTGVGKTNLFCHILEGIRARGDQRAIIHDQKGDYVERFYDPSLGDVIFNPMDQRCAKWNIFNELESVNDIEAVCHSLLPENVQGASDMSYWIEGARAVLIGAFHALWATGRKTNKDLWQLGSADASTILYALSTVPGGRRGMAQIPKGAPKQALGVLSTLMQYIAAFEYLAAIDGDWSVRRWVQSGKGWVFVVNTPKVEHILKPVLSLMIDLVGREILSLPEDLERRIFVMVDELGMLKRLPTLVNLLTGARSKGGSCWLGVQDYGRTNDIYGRNIAGTIFNNCSTLACFRVNDPETSNYIERALGRREITQLEETTSVGPAELRQGVSFIRRDKMEEIVLASEISQLPNLEALVRVSPYNVVRTTMTYREYPTHEKDPSRPAPLELRQDLALSEDQPTRPPADDATLTDLLQKVAAGKGRAPGELLQELTRFTRPDKSVYPGVTDIAALSPKQREIVEDRLLRTRKKVETAAGGHEATITFQAGTRKG